MPSIIVTNKVPTRDAKKDLKDRILGVKTFLIGVFDILSMHQDADKYLQILLILSQNSLSSSKTLIISSTLRQHYLTTLIFGFHCSFSKRWHHCHSIQMAKISFNINDIIVRLYPMLKVIKNALSNHDLLSIPFHYNFKFM